MASSLNMTGLDAFLAGLEAAQDAGVEAIAQQIADGERADVPVDTGDLKNTIRVEGAEGSRQRQVIAGDGDTDYAADVNYGTSKSPAQPFVEPAVERVNAAAIAGAPIAALAARSGV